MTRLTPTEFKAALWNIQDKLQGHKLINDLVADLLEVYPNPGTLLNKLGEYRKPLYGQSHPNEEFNEEVTTKNGKIKQHFAVSMLQSPPEKLEELNQKRQKAKDKASGFDEEGEAREVELPKIDCSEVIEKACSLLQSTDPMIVASGILPLIGRRSNEQNMPARYYEKEDLIIQRQLVKIDEFTVKFTGISKKGANDDWFIFNTLAPASLIVDAQNRFLNFPQVKKLSTDYEAYRIGFHDTFSNRFFEIWGQTLSTIEAYDDDGIIEKANGTTHKARSFYACCLRAIYHANNVTDAQTIKLIQKQLCHDTEGETAKYLAKFDKNLFTNPPNIPLETNIQKLQPMKNEGLEVIEKPHQFVINPDEILEHLTPKETANYQNDLNSGVSFTTAFINILKGRLPQKELKNYGYNQPSVSDIIHKIISSIMVYNEQQTIARDCVYPSYAVINRVYKIMTYKEVAKETVRKIFEPLQQNIDERMTNRVGDFMANSKIDSLIKWNSAVHRLDMDNVIQGIMVVINNSD